MERYTVPAHVQDFIKAQGYPFPASDMDTYIQAWWELLHAHGDFWDYNDRSGGVYRRVHRRSIRPAKRVAKEWATLMLDEKTTVDCGEQTCTDWLAAYYSRIGFFARAQRLVQQAFALGTGAWALWLDTERGAMQVRRYSGSAVLPLSWDDDGVSECAFASQASVGGKIVDQVQMHLRRDDGYHIVSHLWDARTGREIEIEGVAEDLPTGCPTPTFAIVTPGTDNTCVELSPYGESVYADAIDTLQSVDLCYDAIMNEVDLSKMRVFISDLLIDYQRDGEQVVALPFGHDNVVFRKVDTGANSSVKDSIEVSAPAMRTAEQLQAYRAALQSMGDACGFGLHYFDIDQTGGIRTATEVSSDNSQLMRSIATHENALGASLAQISRAVLHCARSVLSISLPAEGDLRVIFDDSIIQDTQALKQQDMAEVTAGVMSPWEYRVKWYGEDETTARERVPEQGIEPSMQLG